MGFIQARRSRAIVGALMATLLFWAALAGSARSQVAESVEAQYCMRGTTFEFTVVRRGLSVDTNADRIFINADGRWADVTGPDATEQIFVAYGFDAGAGPVILREAATVFVQIRANVTPPDRWADGTGAVSATVTGVEVSTGI